MPSYGSHRGRWLGTTALIGALLGGAGFAGSAAAASDCGVPVGGVVICDAGNETPAGAYQDADGITYAVPNLTIEHPGDGVAPTEFISSGGAGNYGTLVVNSSGAVEQTAVSSGTAPAGIFAQSNDGGITITTTATGTVDTSGDTVEGIYARSGGAFAVVVTALGTVNTVGGDSRGIVASSAGGPVIVTSAGVGTTGGGSTAIQATSGGSGVSGFVSVTVTGLASTLGGGSLGVNAESAGGPITIITQSVTTVAGGATGIRAQTGGVGDDGFISVTANGQVSTLGGGSRGIDAYSTGGGTVIVQAQGVSTQGGGAYGIRAASNGAGSVVVTTAGQVATVADGADGIVASSQGTVSITTAGVSTQGAGAEAIRANSSGVGSAGSVFITVSGQVSTLLDGSDALVANSTGGPVIVITQGVSTEGAGAQGILVNTGGTGADGAISVTAQGQVSTEKDGAEGIYARSAGGPVFVSAQGISTLGAGAEGIYARSDGTGAYGGIGIGVSGQVSTGGVGIQARTQDGSVTINAQGITTSGGGADAVNVRQYAATGGLISVTLNGAVSAAGGGAGGVEIYGRGGALVRTQAITTLNDGGSAIEITNTGGSATGDIDVTAGGTIQTGGNGSDGIRARNSVGMVTIRTQDITTLGTGGGSSAIEAEVTAAGGADLTITAGNLSTISNGSWGVYARSTGLLDVTVASVATQGDGSVGVDGHITVANEDALSILVTGAISTVGNGALGVRAINAGVTGDATVDVTVRGLITTQGNGSIGVLAQGNGGLLSLRVADIDTQGLGAFGVRATDTAGGGIEAWVSGLVATSGDGATGIELGSTGTIQLVANAVSSSGEDATAISALGEAGVTLEVGTVQGGWDAANGVQFGSTVAGIASTLTVVAGGDLSALSDQTVRGAAGDEAVVLAGHAVGGMELGAGDDTLRILQGGRFDLRNFADTDGDGQRDTEGASAPNLSFGAGLDDYLDLRTGGVLGLAVVGPDDIGTITGLETFDNRGLITLADAGNGGSAPGAGDKLYAQAGIYTGFTGALLHLDARLDAGGATQLTDRFLIDGGADGTTLVSILNDLGQGAATGNGNTDGISIVQVSGMAGPAAFQLANPEVAGAWRYEIVAFDPGSSAASERDVMLPANPFWDYRLQSSFYDGVFEYAALAQGANLLAQAALGGLLERPDEPPAIAAPAQSADLGATDAQLAVRPTAGDGVATGGWLSVFGEGLRVSPDNGGDFEQDNFGLQAGHDVFGWRGVFGSDDRMILGLQGTIAQGQQNFAGSDSESTISLYGGGAYAAYASGGLRIDLATQLLTGGFDFSAPGANLDQDLDLTTLGVGLGVSHRWDLGRLFVRPGLELRYVHSWMEDFEDDNQVDIGLDDGDSLIARSQLRAGVSFENVAPYLSVGVVHEFLGETGATASGLAFDTSTGGTTFEVGGGLAAWALASNLTLTLDGTYRFGEEVQGLSVTGGLKLSW